MGASRNLRAALLAVAILGATGLLPLATGTLERSEVEG
jgi:hypothetical protein